MSDTSHSPRPTPPLLTRRLTLGLLGGAAALRSAGPATTAGRSIAVIGAGLAGLSAARALAASGARVTVIEARERIGGRIWTSRAWPDMPMDLGASWIHGTIGNPLSALADEAAAKRLPTSYDSSMALNAQGQEFDIDADDEKAEALVEAARGAAEKSEADVPLSEAIQNAPQWREADERTRRMVRHHVNGNYEAEYGGDWTEASSWYIDDAEEYGGGDELFPLGFEQITAHLAKGLDIRLGRRVAAVGPSGRGVTITLADGSALTADHAVITVPLGVLRAGAIRFGAPLDARREAAIGALRMGLLNKCWLRFDAVAWPSDVDWIEWVGPRDGEWAQWVSLSRAAGLPVLLAFHAASAARALEALDDRATADAAHTALKAMFGSSFPAPIAAQITRWSRDPLTLGSYSFNAVGVTEESRADLAGADWDGRLIFAGEAASTDYFGTAHGAVLSGREAAKLIRA